MFVFRWDHGRAEVDVDLFIEGRSRKEWDNLGYKGHHTVPLDGREYEADISMPGRQVFNGIIKVGLVQGLNLTDKITLSASVDVRIVDRPNSLA